MIHTLRPLRPEDAPAAAALIRLAFAAQSIVTDPPASALRVQATDVLGRDGAVCVLADGSLAGVVLWQGQGDGLYLERVSVHPGQRRRGIARALVAAGEAEARRRGLPRIHLSTRLVLADNRRLFAACGLVESTQHAHPGYAVPTYVDMEKRLA